MRKSADIVVVRALLVSSLICSALVLFWLIFDSIRRYQQINGEIEVYLKESLNNSSLLFSDQIVDQMLEKRLDSLKELLSLLFHLVIVLFGFVSTFVDNNSLVLVFALILSCGLTTNLFIEILFSNSVIVLAVILLTLSWLYFDLNSGVTQRVDRV